MFIKLNNYYIRRDKIKTFHYYSNKANNKFWLEVWVAGDELVITYPDSESLSIDIEKLKEALFNKPRPRKTFLALLYMKGRKP